MKKIFNIKYTNKITAPAGSGLNYRKEPNTSSKIYATAKKGKSKGRTTGTYIEMSDGPWWEVLLNKINVAAWARQDVTKLYEPKKTGITEKQAKKLIDGLIESDDNIYHSLLKLNALIDNLRFKGYDVSKYEKVLLKLANRLKGRQELIKNSKILKYKTGLKKGYEKLRDKFIRKISGIGAIGTLAAIIIGGVAGGGLAIAAYFAFRPSYNESKDDLVLTKELEAALNNLDPIESQKIKADLEKQVDKAYKAGLTSGTFSGMGKFAKPLILMGLGFFVVSKIISKSGTN